MRDLASSKSANLGLAILIGGLTAYRAAVLASSGLGLYVDEAYYWGWAQHLDWGYYSKPPMIAVLIALTTGLCGDGVFCVKLGALLVYPVTTFLVFKLGRELFDARTGLWAAALFLLMPGVSLSNLIISTDVLLLLFWTLGMLAFVRAIATNAWRHWLLLGLAGGLGLLSKYTMVLFAPSVLFALLLAPTWRRQLQNPRLWLAAGLALFIFLPNLIWNAAHEWPTFRHTAEISNLSEGVLHWGELAEFLGGQFVVFGPLSMALFAVAAMAMPASPAKTLLLSFALVFLAVIFAQALFGRANANWAAPAFVAASVLVAHWGVRRSRWLWSALLINAVLMFGVYHYDAITRFLGVELSGKTDPFKRVRGWEQLGQQFAERRQQAPDTILMSEDREILAQLAYQLHLPSNQLRSWNPSGLMRHQYDLLYSLGEKDVGADVIYVTRRGRIDDVASRFGEVRRLRPLEYAVHPDWVRHYEVYWLKGYKGSCRAAFRRVGTSSVRWSSASWSCQASPNCWPRGSGGGAG
ncbi:MAG: glycosyltransferase family 39 protein [Halothiobacillaceae bacterium]